MGQGQKRNKLLVPEASKAMYQFKYEMANEVGISNQIQGDYWGYISSRDCGAVGGAMVRRMIQTIEQQIAQQGNPGQTIASTNTVQTT
ncbi:small acid-soluble spore protein alpha/beta type [Thermacetogenium phaeum DSM 12270]|uniref:Small acid-soluble spore protein alpha/beta type n=1 Tax=Thermacetogenium phaeum (strain ATCC BAA-254 / DSM 26808 / PB) TaxID=1089553 RepID=K4LGM0_THEPS|nr:alpha/beta-type small acid-soluble spore protein [Thermacetogenium phaeum]AFV11222.1 small acid-soluble spore protein alpha/beta type [Thermacetogenium phaeum DSM 12270]